MKSLLNTLCLAVVAMVSLNTLSAATCRMIADSQMTLSEQITHDLVHATWTIDLPSAKDGKVKTILQFYSAGQLTLMERQPLGDFLRKQYAWTVEVSESNPLLLLYDLEEGKSRKFDLVQTCVGLELTDAKSGEKMDLDFHARAASTTLTHLQETLVGEWVNSLYPFEVSRNDNKPMPGAFLYYRFNTDGTYSKSLGNSEAQLDEIGQWEISADGQYLLMHTDEYQAGRKVKKTIIATIKFVMYDEMVLEHSLQVSNESFCTALKDFYFSKV